ncbi:MAG: hypothetical protein ACRD7E_28910 [Bryobacteraceae bacterium]
MRKKALAALAGVEIGVIGGAVMLLWFAAACPVIGEPWWLIPNLLASNFYSLRTVFEGPGMATLSGAALQLSAAGLIGAIHGLFMNGVLTPGGRLFGLAVALAWYLLCYLSLWKRVTPAVLAYGPQPLIAIGYFLYGSALGWQSHLLNRLNADLSEPEILVEEPVRESR